MRNNGILIVFALFSLGLLFFVKAQDQRLENNTFVEKKPQEYMTDFLVTIFTKEGGLENKLSAHYWAYQPEKAGSNITKPHLIIYKPDGSLWTIDANHGFIKQANIGKLDRIHLHHQVVINRPAMSAFVPLKLETDKLFYEPSKEYAETDQLVVMTKPGLKISGIGMRAFLDKSFVELLHDVKTSYLSTR